MIACSEQNSRPSVQSEDQALEPSGFKRSTPSLNPPRDTGENIGGGYTTGTFVPEIYALEGTADIAGMFVDEGLT